MRQRGDKKCIFREENELKTIHLTSKPIPAKRHFIEPLLIIIHNSIGVASYFSHSRWNCQHRSMLFINEPLS